MAARVAQARRRLRAWRRDRASTKAARDPERLLARAGWTPERRVDPEPSIAVLRDAGFATWPALADFLERYEGIVVVVPKGGYEAIRFEALAVGPDEPEAYAECARHAGTDLVPIGASNNLHATVLLGRDGRLYGLFWPYFWSLGASVTEAIVRSLTKDGESSVNLEALDSTCDP
jgi:SUKH-3 immunity protein of toxin-antitoxin system